MGIIALFVLGTYKSFYSYFQFILKCSIYLVSLSLDKLTAACGCWKPKLSAQYAAVQTENVRPKVNPKNEWFIKKISTL